MKSDRKTLWALQRSCNDQRSAKLTVSSEEGKLIAILATMSTSTSMRSLSSRSAPGRSIHLLQKESERCFLKYFWTLPILEIFHSSDVSCLFLPGFTKHNQTCEKERKLTFWCPNSHLTCTSPPNVALQCSQKGNSRHWCNIPTVWIKTLDI